MTLGACFTTKSEMFPVTTPGKIMKTNQHIFGFRTTAMPPFSSLRVVWTCLGFSLLVTYMFSHRVELKPMSAQSSVLDKEHRVTDKMYRLAVLPSSADGHESYYHAHMKAVLQGCQDICRVDMAGEPSLYFDHIRKDVDCLALMTNAAIDAAMIDDEPPQQFPSEMVEAFTYGGKVKIIPFARGVLNQRYMGSTVSRTTCTIDSHEGAKPF